MRDLFPDLATAQFVRTQLPQFLHIVCDLNWNWRKGMRNEVRKRQTKDAVEQTASIYDRFACKLCWRLPGYRTLPTHWWTNSQQSRLLSFTFKQRLENTAPRDYKHTKHTQYLTSSSFNDLYSKYFTYYCCYCVGYSKPATISSSFKGRQTVGCHTPL